MMKRALFCLFLLAGGCLLLAAPVQASPGLMGEVLDDPALADYYETREINGQEIIIGPKGGTYSYLRADSAGEGRQINIAYNAWEQLVDDGFGGGFSKAWAFPAVEHKGWLYFTVWDFSVGGEGEVWRLKKGDWQQIRPAGYGSQNYAVGNMAVIGDWVYFSLYGAVGSGAEIWRTNGTDTEQVGADGFGDNNNTMAEFLGEKDGYTYLGFTNTLSGAELWRSRDGGNWSQVNADGFGDVNNTRVTHKMVDFKGHYYVSVTNDATGTEIWRSDNGTGWSQVNADGFGDANNTRSDLYANAGRLFALTMNTADGTEVWRTKSGADWTQRNVSGYGDANNIYSRGASVDGRFYVAMENWWTPSRLFRTKKAKNWNEVTPAVNGNDLVIYPFSINGQLVVSTFNWAEGAKIWMRHKKDDDWQKYNHDGMNGDLFNDWAWLAPRKKYLVAGIENFNTGAQAWRLNFAPAPIRNLEVSENTPEKVVLRWRAPGGQDRDHYVVKRYKRPITEENWHKAKLVDDEKEPRKRKKKQKKTIEMPARRTYYFAVKTLDSGGIESAISNVPVAIRDLEADNVKKKRATLKWSEDETAQHYNVQIRTADGEKLKTWKEITSTRKVTPKGWLDPGTAYKFRVRSVNWDGDKEAWSPYEEFTTSR